jgi:dTDP-4-amino-4,6-dideoxygalactose transaminase
MIIRHSRPWIGEEEVAAVTAVLRVGELATGQKVRRFEEEIAERVGQRYGVATSSGTAALHLALLGLGVGQGHEVVLPSYACTAILNAVHHAGATPVLCDVDEETGNLDPDDARRRFTGRTRAVIVVHLFGHPADLDWVQSSDVPVIEDCAQALGAGWRGRPVGSVGAVSVFSFYATKVISTGEGGMVCCSSPAVAERVRELRDYDNPQSYRVRYNYKMSDLQAGLGLAQLARLPAALARRRALAERYDNAFADLDVLPPAAREGCEPIAYRYVVRTNELARALPEYASRSVECKRPVFRPLHHYLNGKAPSLPHTDLVYAQAISLPLYPALADTEADRLIAVTRDIFGRDRSDRRSAREHYVAV